MQELEELEIRLAKALDRIAALTNTLSKSNIHPNIERSNRLEQHILILTDQLEAQETENIRLLKVVTELQEHNKNFDLAENEQTDLSDQINNSLRAEITNLNALRARDLAEIDEILKAIDPILIQGQS
ncbi:MAG: hypothetical protein ACJZ89_08345 [Paracoccaceae bacterium]